MSNSRTQHRNLLPHEEMYSLLLLLSGWWCWIKWRICCCSSGSCWWSVELVRDVDVQTLIRSLELKLMTSGLISGVLAFFFFSGRIQTPGTTFETAALNYYWMPIIVRFTFTPRFTDSHLLKCSAIRISLTLWCCHLYILNSDWSAVVCSALQLHTEQLNFTKLVNYFTRNDILHTCPLQIFSFFLHCNIMTVTSVVFLKISTKLKLFYFIVVFDVMHLSKNFALQ